MAQSAILVTGAGGFIGRHVAQALEREHGAAVRGATRDGRAIGNGITPCALDVRDGASIAAALAGVDAVVHCAVGDRATTVDGTGLLLRAAQAAGVRRVVHLSSIAVYGDAAGVVDEQTALIAPHGEGYGPWKSAGEALCRGAVTAGADIVILRPTIVYGAGSKTWIEIPVQRVLADAWGGLGEVGRGTCNPVHVSDVAAACRAALHAPAQEKGEAFNIAGAETLRWSDWYARLAQYLGRPLPRELAAAAWRRRALAGLPFKALARIAPRAGSLFERQILAAPAASELRLFGLEAIYPANKAIARLGWLPQMGLEQGLADALAPFHAQKRAA